MSELFELVEEQQETIDLLLDKNSDNQDSIVKLFKLLELQNSIIESLKLEKKKLTDILDESVCTHKHVVQIGQAFDMLSKRHDVLRRSLYEPSDS